MDFDRIKAVTMGLIISMLLTFVFVGLNANLVHAQPTTLHIDPPQVTVPVCTEFTVNVNVEYVKDLYIWQFKLTFDPNLLTCLNVTEGPFLKSHGPTIWPTPIINNTAGYIIAGCALMMPPGVSGSGTLAIIAFHCKGLGSCPLHFVLSDTFLYNSNFDLIPFEAIDGFVTQIQEEKALHGEDGLFYSVHLHADFLINLMSPICTKWHEIWPNFCSHYYHLNSWEDNGDHILSPSDQIDMIDLKTEAKSWWHVDAVTVTIIVTEKGVPAPIPIYVESTGGFPEGYKLALIKPVFTYWHSIYPVFSNKYQLTNWNDTNHDGMLSFCDYIQLFEIKTETYKWYHIENVGTDIIVTRKPVGTQWHEIYPEFCAHDYHLSSWIDNGDHMLSPCDKIDMTDKATGKVTWWHVKQVTITIVLTEKVPPPVEPLYLEYTEGFPTLYYPLTNPVCTYWHEIWPVYCPEFHLSSWEDNGDGFLSPSDQIDMTDMHGKIHWYHVDDVTIDIWIEPLPQPVHDVAVINVASYLTQVVQGETVPVDVTVQDQGDYPETFSVTAYANLTVIGVQTVSLNPGQTTTIAFNWDTTGAPPGGYGIWAYATPVPGESDLTDNQLWDGVVTVSQYLYLHAEDGLFYSVRLHAVPPIYPVYKPISTTWHELWPKFCSHYYHLTSWEDNNGDERLSPSDQIDMIDEETGQKTWWHVDDVTVTIYLTPLEPGYPPMYLDFDLGWEGYDWVVKHPFGLWHEIWPVFCRYFNLTSWQDSNGNGILDYCDYVDLTDESGIVTWWHVEVVTTDITVTRKPVCTEWHELFPRFSQYYHLSSWEDNGDDVLSPCDQIDLHVDWPEFHHDPALIGYSTSTAPNTNNRLWTYNTNAPVYSSPAIVKGILYIGSTNGIFYALNAQTGAVIWTFATRGPIMSSPAVAYGIVYFLSCDGNIYALDAATGALRWSVLIDNGPWPWSSPAVTQGKVFIADSGGWIHCLNAFNGGIIWSTFVGGNPNGPIAVANNKVFSGTHNLNQFIPTLVALNEQTGAIVWTYSYTASVPGVRGMVNMNGAAVVDGDGDGNLEVYFGICAWDINTGAPAVGEAIALDEGTGTEIWRYTFQNVVGVGGWGPGWSTSTPAVHAGKVFIGSDDQNVYALNAATGAKIWSYTTKAAVWSSPAVADGKVFVGSLDHLLYALNENTGALVWCYNTSLSRIWGSPAVACGKVFVGSQNGKVYAFGSKENAVKDYHVVDVTFTIKVTELIEESPLLYFELKIPEKAIEPGFDLLASPIGTLWHEIWPKFCRNYKLTSWEDNGDGWLNPCDYIDMTDELGIVHWYHVEDISIDIVIEPKPPCPKVEWTQTFGPIDYFMTFCPSPAVANLDKDMNLEIVTGTDEWWGWQKWHCFDATGAYQWTLPTGCDESRTSVAIGDIDLDGDLEMAGGCTSGWQTQVFTDTGNFVWKYSSTYYDWWHASPAICDINPTVPGLEVIAAEYFSGKVFAFSKTGTVLWTFQTQGITNDASPACADIDNDGVMEVVIGESPPGGVPHYIYAINGITGALEWKHWIQQPSTCSNRAVHSSAALADIDNDGKVEVIFGANDGGVRCLKGTDGTLKWTYWTCGSVYSSPAIGDVDADGTLEIIVGSNDGRVYCLNGLGGVANLEWFYQTGGAVISSAALANSGGVGLSIYIGSKDSKLYKLDGIGNLIWSFNTGATNGITASPAVADIDGDSKLEVMFTDWNAIPDSWTTTNVFWVLEDCTSRCLPYAIEWAMFRHDRCHTGKYSSGIKGASTATSEANTVKDSTEILSPDPDVAIVFDWLSKTFITAGETVDVYVTVKNQGGSTETTTVTVTYDGNFIGSAPVTLNSGQEQTLTFPWNTAGVPKGVYSVTAEASLVPGETDTFDNTFSTMAIIKEPVHDITIASVKPFKTAVGQGYGCPLNVTVFNQGDFPETFAITAFYESDPIGQTKTATLNPSESITLTLTWTTLPDTAKGSYSISGLTITPIIGETDTADNTLIDGTVRVTRGGDFGTLSGGYYAFDDQCNYQDLFLFRKAYVEAYHPLCDFDNNQDVNYLDLFQFRKCYLAP